jgi:hypothetical protein
MAALFHVSYFEPPSVKIRLSALAMPESDIERLLSWESYAARLFFPCGGGFPLLSAARASALPLG